MRPVSPARARLEQQRRRRVRLAGRAALQRAVAKLSRAQRRFFKSKAKRRSLVAGRQSGKTHLCMLLLIQAALEPNTLSLYFAPTRNAARSILWEKLKRWLRDAGLAVEFNESLLEARFANGSVIRLLGVPDKTRAERHRGLTVNGIVVVDEAAFFGEEVFKHLLTQIIIPYFMTTRQNIACVSSPGLVPRGHFYSIATDESLRWERHVFTLRDNPAVKDKEAALAELREANGWTKESPGYLREGEAQWVADTDLAVYDITDVNVIEELPPGPWTTVLVFDQGGGGDDGDPDVTGVLGWREYDPALYLLHIEALSGDVTDLANCLKRLRKEHKPIRIIGDLGALGKKSALEMSNRHRLPIEAAEKTGKPIAIRTLNADARRGLVLIPSIFVEAIQQLKDLKWDPKAVGIREHPSMPNDYCDVLLYGHRASRHHRAEKPPPPAPAAGTPEAIALLERQLFEAQQAKIERERKIENGMLFEEPTAIDELAAEPWP